MSDEEFMFEAARDVRRSLELDVGAARRRIETKVRHRRRSRKLMAGGGALVLVAAVAMLVLGGTDPGDEDVVAGPGPSTAQPSSSTATALPITSGSSAPSTTAPLTETEVIRVETLVGDIFELTVPRAPAFAKPIVVHYPSTTGVSPGKAVSSTVERGSGEEVAQAYCRNPVGPGCVPSERVDFDNGNTFVRWRFIKPDGSVGSSTGPELATVSNGEWTVLIEGPDEVEARRVAEGLTIATSGTGGPRLSFADPTLRSQPNPTGDVSLIFQESPDDIPVFVFLSHDCSSLASTDVNDPGRECIDGVGVRIRDDNPALAAQLRSVFRIKRVA